MQTTIPTLQRNSAGWYYIHWSEKDDETGVWRSQRKSCRTQDTEIAKRALARRLDGSDGQPKPSPKRMTVAELLDEYEQGGAIRGIKLTQLMALRPIRRAWGALYPEDLTPSAVAKYVQERQRGLWTVGEKRVKPQTVRRELEALTAALHWCLSKRLLLETEYVEPDLPPRSPKREVYLTGPEANDLFKRAADFDAKHKTRLELFCTIAVDCCARADSIENLAWNRVDMERRLIDFREPGRPVTNKRREIVPMSDAVWTLLKAEYDKMRMQDETGAFVVIPPRSTELVVGRVSNNLWRKFISTTPYYPRGLTRHDLRRTGASLMIARGVDLLKVAKMLGDNPETVLKHYACFAPDYLADVHAKAPNILRLENPDGQPT